MADKMVVVVSFKEDERWLYNYISKSSCKSGKAKDLIIAGMSKPLIEELKNEQ